MASKFTVPVVAILALSLTSFSGWHTDRSTAGQGTAQKNALEQQYKAKVQPFVERYCIFCHGAKKPKAQLDLSLDMSVAAIVKNIHRWEQVLERLEANEMPPEDAPKRPTKDERTAVIAWLRELRDREA